MRHIAPRFEEAVDGDALLQMLAVVPAIEVGFVGWIDVHRRQQHAFSSERHFLVLHWTYSFAARSAIERITASRTPGS
jgi:hypothetical protein